MKAVTLPLAALLSAIALFGCGDTPCPGCDPLPPPEIPESGLYCPDKGGNIFNGGKKAALGSIVVDRVPGAPVDATFQCGNATVTYATHPESYTAHYHQCNTLDESCPLAELPAGTVERSLTSEQVGDHCSLSVGVAGGNIRSVVQETNSVEAIFADCLREHGAEAFQYEYHPGQALLAPGDWAPGVICARESVLLFASYNAPDSDGDRVCDTVDNCPSDTNTDQVDSDLDHQGDICDETPCNGNCITEVDLAVVPPVMPSPDAAVDPSSDLQTSVSNQIGGRMDSAYWRLRRGEIRSADPNLDPKKAAVVRGRVARDVGPISEPLEGVSVSILEQPATGKVFTDSNGEFEFVVTGGPAITVVFRREGSPEVHRRLGVGYGRTANLPEVLLVEYGPPQALVAGDPEWQTAASTRRNEDGRGSRKIVVLIPPGTYFRETRRSDGAYREPNAAMFGLVEFTSTRRGLDAMPATLPPTTGYTFAMEGADINDDVENVEFVDADGVPVDAVVYVDNFIGAPVGSAVPSGYYDRARGQWVASADGRVIALSSDNAGQLNIEVGDTDMEVTDEESLVLASAYGDELGNGPVQLWRIPVRHMTPWDFNWNRGCDNGVCRDWPAPPRRVPPTDPLPDPPPGDDLCFPGSIIQCTSRNLGETIPLPGTGLSLSYRSNRNVGFTASRATKVSIGVDRMPGEMRDALRAVKYRAVFAPGIESEGDVPPDYFDVPVGPRFSPDREIEITPPSEVELPLGLQSVDVTLSYGFLSPREVANPDQSESAFGERGNASGPNSLFAVDEDDLRWVSVPIQVEAWYPDARSVGLGGWTLGPLHSYDPTTGRLLRGDGFTESASVSGPQWVIESFANLGNNDAIAPAAVQPLGVKHDDEFGIVGYGDLRGLPIFRTSKRIRTDARTVDLLSDLHLPHAMYAAFAGDRWGNLYTVASSGATLPGNEVPLVYLVRLRASGQIDVAPLRFEVNGCVIGESGHAESAIVAPDERIYFTYRTIEGENDCAAVFRFDLDLAQWAEMTPAENSPDELFPSDVYLSKSRVAVPWVGAGAHGDPEGRVDAPGLVRNGDGTLADWFGWPRHLAVGPDGTLFVADNGRWYGPGVPTGFGVETAHHVVYWISPDGATIGVAAGARGEGRYPQLTGKAKYANGSAAVAPQLGYIAGITASMDGDIYFAEAKAPPLADDIWQSTLRVYQVRTDGTMWLVAGSDGPPGWSPDYRPAEGALAETQALPAPNSTNYYDLDVVLTAMPDGSVTYSSGVSGAGGGNRVYRFRKINSTFDEREDELYVPRVDGSEVYVFSTAGRHLRTLDGDTGATIVKFEYNGDSLVGVSDGFGRTTTIRREDATTIRISGPGDLPGTAGSYRLTIGDDTYLGSVENPDGTAWAMGYYPGGLLAWIQDPLSHSLDPDAYAGIQPQTLEDIVPQSDPEHPERSGRGSHFSYDDEGRLVTDANPAGGTTKLETAMSGRLVKTGPAPGQNYEPVCGGGACGDHSANGGVYFSRQPTSWAASWESDREVVGGLSEPEDAWQRVAREGDTTTVTTDNGVERVTTVESSPRWRGGVQVPAEVVFSAPDLPRLTVSIDRERDPNSFDPFAQLPETTTITATGGLESDPGAYPEVSQTAEIQREFPSEGILRETVTSAAGVSTVRLFDRPNGACGAACGPWRLRESQTGNMARMFIDYDPEVPSLPQAVRYVGVSDNEPEARETHVRRQPTGYVMYSGPDEATSPINPVTIRVDEVGRADRATQSDDDDVLQAMSIEYDADGEARSVNPPGQPAHSFERYPSTGRFSYVPPQVDISDPEMATLARVDGLHLESAPTARPDSVIRSTYSEVDHETLVGLSFPEGALRFSSSIRRESDPDGTGREKSSVVRAPVTSEPEVGASFGRTGPVTLSGRLTVGSGPAAVNALWRRRVDSLLRTKSFEVVGTTGEPWGVSIGRDGAGRPDLVGELSLGRHGGMPGFISDGIGLITDTQLDVVTTRHEHNSFGEAEVEQVNDGLGVLMLRREYVRDQIGRITDIVETRAPEIGGTGAGVNFHYEYDGLGRLSLVNEAGAERQFQYDANGNRIGTTTSGTTEVASIDAQDRLTNLGGTQSFEYDVYGRLARHNGGAGGDREFGYDALGNLLWVTDATGNPIVTYRVDGLGRRVGRRLAGGTWTYYLYLDALRPIAELDDSGSILRVFVYATGRNVPDYIQEANRRLRVVTDHLGSVVAVVDSLSSDVVQWRKYDAWGVIIDHDEEPDFEQPFGFAGGLHEPTTGLVRFGYRDYAPALGRWTAKDPIGFGGGDTNLYGYASSDPLNAIDPSGLKTYVVVTHLGTSGEGFSPHTGVIIVRGNIVMAYDPGGSFPGYDDMVGAFKAGGENVLYNYLNYQTIQDWQDISVYGFDTTLSEELKIANNADEIGGCFPGQCAYCSKRALRGEENGRFSELEWYGDLPPLLDVALARLLEIQPGFGSVRTYPAGTKFGRGSELP